MSWNWIAFGVGLFLGMAVGIFIMGLLVASRERREAERRYCSEVALVMNADATKGGNHETNQDMG